MRFLSPLTSHPPDLATALTQHMHCMVQYTIASLLSLSTVVLNSKGWSEIIWLLEILRFKNQSCNRLYPKKPAGMHRLGYNDVVSWLNKAKT